MYKKLGLFVILSLTLFTGGKKPTTRLPTFEIQVPVQGFQLQSKGNLFDMRGKFPEAETTDTSTENSSISQNESNSVNIDEQTNLTDPDKLILFISIIKPCPNIDYKMRVYAPNPNIDPRYLAWRV
jgi:hypothetical protein